MTRFVLLRLALLIPTLVGICFLVFLMIYLVPGDPAQIMLGERADAASIAAVKSEMGWDQPFHVQFGRFFMDLFQGDLGRSFRTHELITTEIMQHFPATVELTFASMIIAIIGGITFGILSAVKQNSMIDRISMTMATAGISMPVFWLGLMLILLLAVQFPLFPISGRLSASTYIEPITHVYIIDAVLTGNVYGFVDVVWHLVLPAVTLATIPLAFIARMTRANLLEILGEDFVRTAWAKGLTQRRVVLRHALRNAFVPTLTVISLQFGYLLGGAVITETIFSWPGLGRWVFLAVQARDLRAVQGGVILIATIFVLVNLATDIIYGYIDPRIRYNH